MPDKSIDEIKSPLKIMLIDDNQDERNHVLESLLQKGCRLLTAPDGRSGAELAAMQNPDLVVLNVDIPRGLINYYDFINNLPPIQKPTVIIATPHTRDPKIRGLLDQWAAGRLIKPVNILDLQHWIDQFQCGRLESRETVSEDEVPLLDEANLLQRTGGDHALLKEMVEAFHRETRIFLNCGEDISQKTIDELRRAAHSLCSMSAALGLQRLTVTATEFRLFAEGQKEEETLAVLRKLKSLIESSVHHLNDFAALTEDRKD